MPSHWPRCAWVERSEIDHWPTDRLLEYDLDGHYILDIGGMVGRGMFRR